MENPSLSAVSSNLKSAVSDSLDRDSGDIKLNKTFAETFAHKKKNLTLESKHNGKSNITKLSKARYFSMDVQGEILKRSKGSSPSKKLGSFSYKFRFKEQVQIVSSTTQNAFSEEFETRAQENTTKDLMSSAESPDKFADRLMKFARNIFSDSSKAEESNNKYADFIRTAQKTFKNAFEKSRERLKELELMNDQFKPFFNETTDSIFKTLDEMEAKLGSGMGAESTDEESGTDENTGNEAGGKTEQDDDRSDSTILQNKNRTLI